MLYSILNSLFLASLLAFSHGLLKWVSSQQIHVEGGYFALLFKYWFFVGAAISVYVFIFFYYIYVLRNVNIGSFYAAYTGLSITFVFLIGIYYFQEPMQLPQLLGIFLIIVGIFLVSG